MNVLSLILSLLAVIISIVSWFVHHSLSRKRDFENKKREIRINYIIDAWQLLEHASHRQNDRANCDNIERAIASVQLFGTQEQILMAQFIAENIQKSGTGYSLEILKKLRKDLREELGIEPVEDTFRFLRFTYVP